MLAGTQEEFADWVSSALSVGSNAKYRGRVNNSAPDTDGGRNGVLSRDKQINVAFADGKGVPPFKVQKIGQVNKVAKSDSSVPVMEGLYEYC